MSRKRKKKGVSPILKDLADQVTAEGRIEKFVFNPRGEISMSDAISTLIEPYKQDAPDYNSFNNLVTFACIAWNTSILPEEKREKAVQSRSTTNLTAMRLKNFQEFMFLTDGIMVEGQKAGVLRKDFKARYLTYIFLGALETFISAMVLVDQKIKGNRQKERIAESILEVFLNGASSRSKRKKP